MSLKSPENILDHLTDFNVTSTIKPHTVTRINVIHAKLSLRKQIKMNPDKFIYLPLADLYIPRKDTTL